MKTLLKTSIAGIFCILLLSGFSLREHPEDPPRGAKKKHLKMVKVENGKETVIDTVLSSDADAMTWFSENDFSSEIDSVIKKKLRKYEVKIDEKDGKENVFIFSTDGGEPFHWQSDMDVTTETIVDGDSIVKVIMLKKGDGDVEEKIFHVKPPHPFVHVPHPPMPPKVEFFKHRMDGNVIDLNAPGIISYKKKDLSGGREKIEIIRKKPQEFEEEIEFIEKEED